MSAVSMDEVRATYKARDSWWTVLLVDPIAGRLVRLVAGRRWVTPNLLTSMAFLLGLAAAGAFLAGPPPWLAAGALLYFASFVIDCMDGKIARLHDTGSVFGSWVDFILDRLRVILCTAALFVGQFLHTGSEAFLLVAIAVVFLALFGYVNGAEIDKAMARISALDSRASGNGQPRPEVAVPPTVDRVREALHRHRIRLNLISGVEFEMAVFVVAPLIVVLAGPTALVVVAVLVGVLLLGFELALTARFWRAARAFDRTSRPVPVPRDGDPAAGAGDARGGDTRGAGTRTRTTGSDRTRTDSG